MKIKYNCLTISTPFGIYLSMAQRYKSPDYHGKPNPVALAMRRLGHAGTRRLPNKKAYRRADARRDDRKATP